MATAYPRAPRPNVSRYAVDCRLDYRLDACCDFVFMVHAARTSRQRVFEESLELTPGVRSRLYTDVAGNRVLRLQAPTGPLVISYRAKVELEAPAAAIRDAELPIDQLPDEVWPLLLPTRYCESDLLGGAARKLFGAKPPGWSRVIAVCDWLGQNIKYRPGTTQATTTARDVFVQRVGVCRDFAHLGISFCRALNIPARLVCGYTQFSEPPPDFHAVFEAFLGGQWVLFDPTALAPVDSLIRIATGPDAKDVAFATIFGPAYMQSMSPQITPLPQTGTNAASTSRSQPCPA